jgi:hypothetical protein
MKRVYSFIRVFTLILCFLFQQNCHQLSLTSCLDRLRGIDLVNKGSQAVLLESIAGRLSHLIHVLTCLNITDEAYFTCCRYPGHKVHATPRLKPLGDRVNACASASGPHLTKRRDLVLPHGSMLVVTSSPMPP